MIKTRESGTAGSVDHGWTDSGYVEVGLVLLDELKCRLLSKAFGCAVGDLTGRLLVGSRLPCRWVPVFLRVNISRASTLGDIDDRCKGRSDDNAFHVRSILVNRAQHLKGASECRLEEITFWVLDLEYERGCCMDDLKYISMWLAKLNCR